MNVIKHFCILSLIMVSINPLFSQIEYGINVKDTVISKWNDSNSELWAKKISMPGEIVSLNINHKTGYAIFELRLKTTNGKKSLAKSRLYVYDLQGDSLVWYREYFWKKTRFSYSGDVVLEYTKPKTICRDVKTGKILWTNNSDIFYVDDFGKFGLSFPSNALGSKNHLCAVSMIDGKKLWSKKVNPDYGFSQPIRLSDSTMIVQASGIHLVNLFQNGSGWEVPSKTHYVNIAPIIVNTTLAVGLALLTGYYYVPVTNSAFYTEISSNIWIEDTLIYFADREKISKINSMNGNIIWSNSLPQAKTSTSSIFIQNDNIYMLNFGYSNYGGNQTVKGKPFLAAYNTSTGLPLFIEYFPMIHDYVIDYVTDEKSNMIILSNHKISMFDYLKFKTIKSEKLVHKKSEKVIGFNNQNLFIKEEGRFVSMNEKYSDKIQLVNQKGDVQILDSNLRVVNRICFNDIYSWNFTINDSVYISGVDANYIIDDDGLVLVRIPYANPLFKVSSSFFVIDKNSLYILSF